MKHISKEYNKPFISHATKDMNKFEAVLKKGKLISPKILLEKGSILKKDFYNYWGDRWVGRINYVMFSVGLGYIERHKNMPVSFLFSLDTLNKDSEIHKSALLFEKCLAIARIIRKQNKDMKSRFGWNWTDYFRDNDLSTYNHHAVEMGFNEYMQAFLFRGRIQQRDAWGPSVYPQGLLEVCVDKNPDKRVKSTIKSKIKVVENDLVIKGKLSTRKFIMGKLGRVSEHTEVLIPKSVDLWSGNLIGFCVRKRYLLVFKKILSKYKPKDYCREIYVLNEKGYLYEDI